MYSAIKYSSVVLICAIGNLFNFLRNTRFAGSKFSLQWRSTLLLPHKRVHFPQIIFDFILIICNATPIFRPLFLSDEIFRPLEGNIERNEKLPKKRHKRSKVYCLKIVFAVSTEIVSFENKFHFKCSITTLHYNWTVILHNLCMAM